MRFSLRRNEQGFALPVIILLMALMAIVAYTVLSQSTNSLSLTYRQTYLQMARVASKAAIDYAQEQYDNSTCGNYSGTVETNLVNNAHYRLTMKADVISTSADGLTKTVQGTGSVYLPRGSNNARYVFSVESEIVNTFATCKTPDNYSPLVWLDASNTASLKKTGTSTVTVTATTTGDSGASGDVLKERADNGAQTAASWASSILEMHNCNSSDFTNAVCTTNSSKLLLDGMVFQNVNVPKNATITSAIISISGATPSGSGGSVTHKVVGFYKTAGNPHADLFTSGGTAQLTSKLASGTLHTATSTSQSENNFPPGNSAAYDVTTIAQEMVNNANWNPNGVGNGGRMGFVFQQTSAASGAGVRKANKAGEQLSVTYSITAVSQALSGDSLSEWHDLSGNGNHAIFTYGNAPTRQDNQFNSLPVVRFNNGAFLSSLTTPMSGKRELTAFAVIKPNFGTSSADGRIISGTSAAASNDTTVGSSIIPLLRYSSNSGFSNVYSGTTGSAYRSNYTCGASCASLASLFDSRTEINDATSVNSYLRFNGAAAAEADSQKPAGSPYTFGVNQFYFGGTRTGAMPGSGTAYFNGDYAELIIYDHALTCHETISIENYLRNKWGLGASAYTDNCPNDVPTL